ncbi:TPA: PTS system mannose/fructose/sorbose family transporter subunit IID, partial [Enterococcus faecium]|nr:PTS system mannose/fructose/sorbose family transporter subunit IID [Enterococcus faecium]
MTKTSNTDLKITKKDLSKVFWRSFQMEFSWNYERQMNMAYAYAMIPILKKLYQTKEQMADALKRHLEFFNTTPHIVTLILGINAAMEEENVNDPDFDTSAID